MILFDTDTLTHFSYGNENIRRRIDQHPAETLTVAVVTRDEALGGRARSILTAATEAELRTAVDRYHRTEALLADFAHADFSDPAIAQFGRLRRQKNLKKMGRGDMLIACIALAEDALLVTRNTADFKNVPGLRIENWVD